jgi:hypothetical protein
VLPHRGPPPMRGKGKTRKNHPVAAHCWENMEI